MGRSRSRLVTFGVIDQCLLDDDLLIDFTPDSEFANEEGAAQSAADYAEESGGAFRVVRITRDVLPGKFRANIAKARGK